MKITIHFCISFKTTELVKVALNTKKQQKDPQQFLILCLKN